MGAFETFLLDYEQIIRSSVFLGLLILIAAVEFLAPRRQLVASKPKRWFINITLVFLSYALLRLLFPFLAVGMAGFAIEQGWGLFNVVTLPPAFEFLLAVVLLDLAIYVQHRIFHLVPLFWRFHKMHHVDQDFDVTTGLRFHPVEIIFSMIIKLGVVALLGAPAIAVILFEVILNGMAMFNHGNFRLPLGLDAALRKLVVTPDMHRVHHSIEHSEYNMNYGFNLSLWDRLFASYKAQPDSGHDGMTIGQPDYQEPNSVTYVKVLLLPFTRQGAQAE